MTRAFRSSHFFRRDSGAALTEFALVLPVLLTLLLGMVEFGRLFNYWLDETHLANQGARWAAVNKNPGGSTSLQSYIRQQAAPELRDGSSSVTQPLQVCIAFPSGATVGQPVRVTAAAKFNFIPFLSERIGVAQVTFTGAATMRVESTPSNYSAGCA